MYTRFLSIPLSSSPHLKMISSRRIRRVEGLVISPLFIKMKFTCLFIWLALGLVRCQFRDRWNVKWPLQAITSKISGLSSSKSQVKYVNLSEQGNRPNRFDKPAVGQDIYKTTRPNHLSGRHQSGHLLPESKQVFGEWEEPEVLGNNAQSRHSLLVATRVIPSGINHMYKKSLAATSLYRIPIFEQDSYLEALELSRLPCQTLEDPEDCYDSTQLLRQRPVDETPLSNKFLATIKILVNFHNHHFKY